MPRYTLQELIARANAGNIGARGLKRLQGAGLSTGMAADPLGGLRGPGLGVHPMSAPPQQATLSVNPNADLAARRAALYAHAVQAAHDLQPGQQLSAGLQRRLSLGAGGSAPLAPRSVAGVQTLTQNPSNYTTILDALRKRSKGIASQAGIYRGF